MQVSPLNRRQISGIWSFCTERTRGHTVRFVCMRVIQRDFSKHLGNWIRGLHLEIASRALHRILRISSRPGVSICRRLVNSTSCTDCFQKLARVLESIFRGGKNWFLERENTRRWSMRFYNCGRYLLRPEKHIFGTCNGWPTNWSTNSRS